MAPLALPNTQALRCSTFRPPRDILEQRSMTIPELYDWNGVHNADHPLFTYDDDDGTTTITWAQAVRMIHVAARYVVDRSGLATYISRRPPVIAVLATSDTITYFCTVIGVMRAGFTAFAISPRNSPEAVAHLLSNTETRCVLVSSEPSMTVLAESASKLLQAKGRVPLMHSMPNFEDLVTVATKESFVSYPTIGYDAEHVALILHSSGSTAFPKPILWKHSSLFQRCWIPWHGRVDLAGVTVGWHAMPLYHGLGSLSFFFAPSCGMVLAVFKPRSPAIFPTAENLYEAIQRIRCDMVCCVPIFLEQWSGNAEKIAYLRSLKGVMFGGGPLARQSGDRLAENGVKLYLVYGLTECSVVNVCLSGLDWDYLQIASHIPHEFVDQGQGTAELVLLSGEYWQPQVITSQHDGRNAYFTSDLFVRHPTRPNFWKLYGRKDDQIMLSTGEKTNPGPLETVLNSDPRIKAAIIFGRGRAHNGVLVEPKAEYEFDTRNAEQSEKFRDSIWSSVERMNVYAPKHSRVFKEMIIVASPTKPLKRTPKGTPQRQTILRDYEGEINALYDTVESMTRADKPAISNWTDAQVTSLVREVVHSIVGNLIGENEDIFQFGCDSLQATWIRTRIVRAMRSFNVESADRLPTSFVFRAPTIASMTRFLLQITADQCTDTLDEAAHAADLQQAVARHTFSFPSRPNSLIKRGDNRDVVLVTGTTGGFGCNILAQLSQDPTVKKVYCLNRPSEDMIRRQVHAMETQGLLEDCLRAPKFELVEADSSKPRLGLDTHQYETMCRSVTHIIHNAWPVDFNLTLRSFERSLRCVKNLVDFALSSPFAEPPQVLFVSSVGVFRRPQNNGPQEEQLINDPTVAVGTGYAESKWVAEHILAEASARTGLRTVSVRIGQLCGDRNGHWNEREWFPAIVKSALHVECLPDVSEPSLISWIPSYEAAKAIIAMRNSTEPVLHLINPNPVPFRTMLEPVARALRVPLVSYDQWFCRLQESLKDTSLSEVERMQRNPALRLLDYYRRRWSSDGMGILLDTTKAIQFAPSILDLQLSPALVDRWVASWRSSGFLPTEEEGVPTKLYRASDTDNIRWAVGVGQKGQEQAAHEGK